MLRIIACFVATLFLWSASTQAQFNSFPPGAFLGHASRDAAPVAGFTGPGDIIASATAFYSCARAYTAAYATATGNICDIADAVTGTTSTCTMKVAATGFADLTSSLCTGGTLTVSAFCTAHTSCVVTKMYDQTVGVHCTAPTTSCDMSTATLSQMPALAFSAINGLPCLTTVSGSFLQSATPLNAIATQPFTQAVAAKQTTGGSNKPIFSGNPSIFYGSTTTVGMFAGTSVVTATVTNNVYRGLSFVFNGASSSIQVDNTLTSPLNPGTNGMGIGGNRVVFGDASNTMIGSFCEGGIWPIAFSSGQQTSWFSNANGSSGYNGGL